MLRLCSSVASAKNENSPLASGLGDPCGWCALQVCGVHVLHPHSIRQRGDRRWMPTERGYKRWTDKEKEREKERERVSGPFCGPPSLPLFPCPSFFLLSFRRNCGGCLTGRSGEGDVGSDSDDDDDQLNSGVEFAWIYSPLASSHRLRPH